MVGPIVVSIAFVMELTLVPLLLPAIQAQLDLSIGQLAWVFNAYGIAVALGVLIGGWYGDVFNSRKIFTIGVMFFALGSILVASADRYEAIVVGRAIQGFGGGIFSPLVPLLLTRASPLRPGRVLVIWGSLAGYVAAFAPWLYSTFLNEFSWHLAFIVFAVISILALAIVPGTGGASSVPTPTRTKTRMTKFIVVHELWFMFGYVFCTYGALTYFLFRLPIMLDQHDWDSRTIGLVLSVMWLSFSLVSTVLRNRIDQPNVRVVMLIAPLLILGGFPLAYFCDALVCLLASAVLLGSGLACSNAPSTMLILRYAPPGMTAISASMDITFARVGGVVLVALLSQTSVEATVTTIAVLCGFASFCALMATRSVKTCDASARKPSS